MTCDVVSRALASVHDHMHAAGGTDVAALVLTEVADAASVARAVQPEGIHQQRMGIHQQRWDGVAAGTAIGRADLV